MKCKLIGAFIFLIFISPAHTADALSTPSEQLINRNHPLQPIDYVPDTLQLPQVLFRTQPSSEMELTAPAANALTAMLTAAHAQGLELVLLSGYRSYATQARLYRDAEFGPAPAKDLVAPPGYSEHQSGLAADLASYPYFCAAESCFMLTRGADWLEKNAHLYGFIQRYPLGKEAFTGYTYEPWHYRYVGTALAAHLYKTGQTLEEYYGQD